MPTSPFVTLPLPDAAALAASADRLAATVIAATVDADAPWAPGKSWSRRDLAWHLADIEAVTLGRATRVAAEDDPDLPDVPQERWVAGLPRRDVRVAADLVRASRLALADLIGGLPPAALAQPCRHAWFGPWTLRAVVLHGIGHADHHAAQLAAYVPATTGAWRITPMLPQDHADAAALWAATEHLGPPPSAERLTAVLGRNPGLSQVARDGDGRLIAAIVASSDGWRVTLARLAVATPWRRRGVATAVATAAIAAATARGIGNIGLMTFAGNTAAEAFWRGLGFERRDDLGFWRLKH